MARKGSAVDGEEKGDRDAERSRDRGRTREVKRERTIRRERETSADGGGHCSHCIQKLEDILRKTDPRNEFLLQEESAFLAYINIELKLLRSRKLCFFSTLFNESRSDLFLIIIFFDTFVPDDYFG